MKTVALMLGIILFAVSLTMTIGSVMGEFGFRGILIVVLSTVLSYQMLKWAAK